LISRNINTKQKAKPKLAPAEPVQLPAHVPLIPAMETEEDPQNTIYGKVTELQKNQPLEPSEDGKTIVLPVPQNGTQYTKIEVLSGLTLCTKSSQ
jgi:hypothetical protein